MLPFRLRRGRRPPPGGYGEAVLFGRGPECARIDRLLAALRQGAGGAVVLSGEAGIGKTALLDYAREHASGLGVLSVTGAEAEAPIPFAALERLLAPVPGPIASLPRVRPLCGSTAREIPGPEDRFAIYAGFFRILTAAARSAALLVVIDDAQWLDRPTLDAVAFAARRLTTERIGILVATREPQGPAGVETSVVRGLGDEAAGQLLADLLGRRPPDDVVAAAAAQAGGNPSALLELAGTLSCDELTGTRPLRLPVRAGSAATRIFGARIAALDDATRRALQVAAVAADDGLPVVSAVLAHLGIAGGALGTLEDTGLTSFAGGRLSFPHPLIRSAAVSDLPPTRRRSLHRAVAEMLTDPAQQDRRAWHLTEATLAPDEGTARELEQSARLTSERRGYAAAAVVMEQAAAFSADEAGTARRLCAAADAARRAGRSTTALRLLDRSDDHTTDPALRAASAGVRGRVELHTGAACIARRVWETGAADIGRRDPARGAHLLAMAAEGALVAGEPEGALRLARRAIRSAPPRDTDTTLLGSLVIGSALSLSGNPSDGMRWLQDAAALARWGTDADVEWVLFAELGAVAWHGEDGDPRQVLDPLVHRLRAEGAWGQLPLALYVTALADSRLGRLHSGRRAATEAVELATRTGDLLALCAALGCLAELEAQLGDEQACRAHAADSLRIRERTRLGEMHRDALDGLGLLELSLNRPDRAVDHLEEANRRPSGYADGLLVARASSADLIEAYVRSGRDVPDAVREQLRLLTELALPDALGALICRGRALIGDDAEYDTWFTKALQLHARSPSPFDTARTALCYGERLRRAGRRRDARKHLEAAFDAFRHIGAHTWAAQAATELGAVGRPVDAPAAAAGHRLTPQELQVARLAARGGTNREIAEQLFLSVKTIEMHLGRLYRKLGIRSRTQLANYLRDNVLA
ncbi:AAA family ATPase [Rhodococcus aetherivorans]|uniref:helix-turn-helix transcriptional regulator n=1 Tax=Rhodococcus aetherivorans TaxID=191292 RepID=UPI0036A125DD